MGKQACKPACSKPTAKACNKASQATANSKAKAKACNKASGQKATAKWRAKAKAGNKASGQAPEVSPEPAHEELETKPLELTPGTLKQHDLDTQLQLLQEGQLDETAFFNSLSDQQKQACWKRFEHGRSIHPQASQDWSELGKTGKGSGQHQKKRLLLFAYLKEGKTNDNYFRVSEKMGVTQTSTQNMKWLTWHETKAKFGEEEAKARVSSGSLAVRKDSKDGRFWEFLVVENVQALTLSQSRVLETAREAKLSKHDHEALSQAMMQDVASDEVCNMASDLWQGRHDGVAGMSLKDLQSAGSDPGGLEQNPGASLPSDLRDLMNQAADKSSKQSALKGGAGKYRADFDAQVDKASAVDLDGSLPKALSKAAQMHGLLSKDVMLMRAAQNAMNKHPNRSIIKGPISDLDENIKAGLKHLDQLDKVVSTQSGSPGSIRSLVMHSAGTLKKSHKVLDSATTWLKNNK